jgi:uroporphyrinogen-III synthase
VARGSLAERVLITRPQPGADRFAASLPDSMIPVIAPLTRIEATGTPVLPDGLGAVLFTSQNGVRFAPEGCGLPAFCVGDKTANAAEARGYRAVSAGGTVDDLITLVLGKARGPFAHLRGEDSIGDVANTLRAQGHSVQDIVVYRAVAHPLPDHVSHAIAQGQIRCVTIFSPRAARRFVGEINPDWPLSKMYAVAISAAAAAPLRACDFGEIRLADAPNAAAMRAALGPVTASSLEGGEPFP